MGFVAKTVFFERVERRSGGLIERRGELLHGSKGFSEFLAEVRSSAVHAL
jgi:hypothetical protein